MAENRNRIFRRHFGEKKRISTFFSGLAVPVDMGLGGPYLGQ